MLIQVVLVLMAIGLIKAVPPLGNKKALEISDEDPPKYEYGYKIHTDKGVGQGKSESRDGVIASGRYYVEEANSSQNVEYVADDWGYHPYVEYKNKGPHSQTVTHIAFDKDAIKALNNKHLRPQNPNLLSNTDEKHEVTEKRAVINTVELEQVEANEKPVVVKLNSSENQEVNVDQIQKQEKENISQPDNVEQYSKPAAVPESQGDKNDYNRPNQYDYISYQPQQIDPLTQTHLFLNHNQNLENIQQYPEYVYVDGSQIPITQSNENILLQPLVYNTFLPEAYAAQYPQQPVQNYQTSELYKPDKSQQNQAVQYDESILQLEHLGGYGSKIQKDQLTKLPAFRVLNYIKNLISEQDVLDINKAINTNEQTSNVDAPSASVSEYPQLNEVNSTQSSTEESSHPKTQKESALSEQPIIVVEMESPPQKLVPEITDAPEVDDDSTVIVTPRPINTALLAPLTAGVELPKIVPERKKSIHQNFVVDIQKSIPYYLGKVEYYDGESQNKSKNVTATAAQHLKLGDFLQQPIIEKPKAEALVQNVAVTLNKVHDNESKLSGNAQEETRQVTNVQHYFDKVEKPQLVSVPVPVKIEVVKEEMQNHQSADKNVEISVPQFIERPYPVPVIINKPYPYPVEKIVHKLVNQPYPVEVPVHIPVPQPVQVTVENRVPVTQYIEAPVPVEKIVEKPVPQYIPKPYPVQVPVQVAQAFYLPIEVPKPYPVEIAKYVLPTQYPIEFLQTPNVPLPNRPFNVQKPNLKKPKTYSQSLTAAASFQSVNKIPCVDLRLFGIHKPYCAKLNNNNYIGLVPPKIQTPFHFFNATRNNVRKQRTAKNAFESSIRWEYGFMPPLIPSLAIDEDGNPVEKHTK